MKRFFRVLMVCILGLISAGLMVPALLPLGTLLRFVRRPEFADLVKLDYSAIWAYQVMMIQPVGKMITVGCLVWAVVLWLFKMRINKWIFTFFFIFNLTVTYAGLPIATWFAAEKISRQDAAEHSETALLEKKAQAREKLKQIAALNLHEQKEILSLLDTPKDDALIPEWEAFGKRIVNFDADEKWAASRHYLLGDAIDALGKHSENPASLKAIDAIERELEVTSVPTPMILFSTLYFRKEQSINPSYQILTEDVNAQQLEMKQRYLDLEKAIDKLRSVKSLENEGDKLLKAGRMLDALKKYRQSIKAASVYSEQDAKPAQRKFVDALLAVGRAQEPGDWETAIQWQKDLIQHMSIQWVNKEILKLWKLYTFYQDACAQAKKAVDGQVVETRFKNQGEDKRKQLEEKFKKFDDRSNVFFEFGSYYYGHLNFDKAEAVLVEGLKYAEDWEAAGKPIDHGRHASVWMFRDVLKNLYLITGQYDACIAQIEAMKKAVENRSPKDRYYSKRSNLIDAAKYEHFILAVQYAKSHHLVPAQLKYADDFNYSFIEFDAPGWIPWDKKYKVLWEKVKDIS